MKFGVQGFKGMLPILGNTKLPDGYASLSINTKLVSGDIEGYLDIANPFQLAKAAPIITLEKADNGDWLQFRQAELASFAFDIRAVPGTIAGDTTGRRYITGFEGPFNGAPQFTNTFYATDPSQQGSNTLHAYPYVTFKLGVPDPLVAPTATSPASSGTTTDYEYAQEGSINNAAVVAAGTGYVVGDILTPVGGQLLLAGFPAQITVNNITGTGAIDTTVAGCISVTQGGFYANNQGPGNVSTASGFSLPIGTVPLTSVAGMPTSGSITLVNTANNNQVVTYSGISGTSLTGCTGGTGTILGGTAVQPAAVTVATSGGTGSGATLSVNVVGQQGSADAPPSGWAFQKYDNGAGSYGHFNVNGFNEFQWGLASGQGGYYVIYSTTAYDLEAASSFTYQVDATSQNNGSAEYPDLLFQFAGTFNGLAPEGQVVGPSLVLSIANGTLSLFPSITAPSGPGQPPGGTAVGTTTHTFVGGTQYRVTIKAVSETSSSNAGFNVTATVATSALPGTILATVNGFVAYMGEGLGMGSIGRVTNGDGQDASFENVLVTVTQPPSAVTTESTSYVYTDVQNIPGDPITQESGPSDPSATIDVVIDGTTNPATRGAATIIIPPAASGENIVYSNLYRLVTDANNDETYTFVTELAAFNMTSVTGTFVKGETVTGGISAATATVLAYGGGVLQLSGVDGVFTQGETITGGTSGAHGTYSSSAMSTTTITYVDTAQDSAIGPAVLISQDWAPPLSNMQGIIAFPNGTMGGFAGNIFCMSAPGYPHAWPVENQYAVDTAITSATPIDTTALLTTQSYPYTAWGTDPSAFSMSKEVSIQGCVATRGVATDKFLGVLFPSGNAYCYYKGQGQLDTVKLPEIGKPAFSYEQWIALTPTSIIAALHDDRLYWFFNNGTTKAGYVQDLRENGAGITQLDFHVTCLYVDKATDTLYLIPDFSTYPINGSVISTAQNIVSQWEAAATYRPRHWERDEMLYGRPVGFQKARVQSRNSGTVNLAATNDQGTAFNGAVTQQTSFTIAALPSYRWNMALDMTGAVRINTAALVEAVEELTV